ncbi:MAG: sensor domain-containing diguanylate cyclase [Sulfuricurvum sp.]|jgi:diguanylate cyclase (GGDEF)-like protein/PAS domain S-box-containing protein
MIFSPIIFGIKSFFSLFNTKKTLFEEIFVNSPTAFSVTDDNGVIQYVNAAFIELTGYTSKELVGNNLSLMKSSKNAHDFFIHFWEKLLEQNSFSGKIWNQHKDSLHALHSVTITPISLEKTYYLSTHVNVTQEVALQERHHYLAYHDPHTGLANRSLFEDRLSHALDNAARIGTNVGILYCDLNEFKQINDEYGHATGDYVLEEVAKRLQLFFRTNDTVARFGGDEFVIVIEHLENDMELSKMADSLKQKIAEPMGKLNLHISASIGIASFPQDGLTKAQLLTVADHKMYHNKNKFYGLVS